TSPDFHPPAPRRGAQEIPRAPPGEEVNRLKGILVLLIGVAVAAAPVFTAIHILGSSPTARDDDCGEKGDHGGDHEHEDDDCDDDGGAAGTGRLISESAILDGLQGGALFPFIDTTPNHIRRAHIAITDSVETCAPNGGAPTNIQVLVGVAGGSLVNVMTSATNTGIGSSTQCVFHVTIVPGQGGVPSQVTDIVILNAGEGPLNGDNTATATAEVA